MTYCCIQRLVHFFLTLINIWQLTQRIRDCELVTSKQAICIITSIRGSEVIVEEEQKDCES